MKRKLFLQISILGLLAIAIATVPAQTQERYTGDPKYLEPSDRDSWQMPERVMDFIGVRPGMVIGEVGAGSGYFTVRLAARIGLEGHIYANEINSRYLDYIKQRCDEDGITNITTILGEEKDPLLPEASLDMVIMVNVYHELSDPVAMMRAILPSLKPNATVVIVDYDRAKRGPRHTAIPEDVHQEVEGCGYQLIRREDFLPRQFILIFRPSHG